MSRIEELNKQRKELEWKLKEVVSEIVVLEIKKAVTEPVKNAGVELKKISWEFYPESDDEGGTNYYPEYVQIFNENGELDEEDLEGIIVKDVRSYGTYEEEVADFVHEILCDHSSDLYDYDIESIEF